MPALWISSSRSPCPTGSVMGLIRTLCPGRRARNEILAPTVRGLTQELSEDSLLFSWDVPDTRLGLLAVDTGARFGAGGTTVTADGAPLSYRAVAGDTLNDIVDRFDITLNDVGFLNPLTSRQLQAGDDLNLQVGLRGGASVPTPWA